MVSQGGFKNGLTTMGLKLRAEEIQQLFERPVQLQDVQLWHTQDSRLRRERLSVFVLHYDCSGCPYARTEVVVLVDGSGLGESMDEGWELQNSKRSHVTHASRVKLKLAARGSFSSSSSSISNSRSSGGSSGRATLLHQFSSAAAEV